MLNLQDVELGVVEVEPLRVTPQHEDEGYLSPSEEDLKNYACRPGGFLNCKSRSDYGVSSSFRNGPRSVEADSIAWEKVAAIPYTYDEHFSWDRLKLPVPYRFHDEHQLCLHQIRKAPSVSFVTDNDNASLPQVVENIWRSYDPAKNATRDCTGEQMSSDSKCAVTAIQLNKATPQYITIRQYIQHVFHLLCGRESLSFSIASGGGNHTFLKNPLVLVHGMSPSVVLDMSKHFLRCGKIFKRLSYVSALHYDEKCMEREGFESNAVFIAFLKFISDYLKLYQTSLMLKATTVYSFSSLTLFIKPFLTQLETLELVLDLYITTDQITLLKGLNTMVLCCETPFVADLLRSVFVVCSAAYLRYVSNWVFRGELSKGFHIQMTKSSTYQDRRYWVKQFSQVTAVPAFLENALCIIFETGKAINLLNLIRNTETRSTLLSCILQDEGRIIEPVVGFNEVALLEAEWQIKLESFFEEYSFLQTDIEAVLVVSGDSKRTCIDFDAIESAKQLFELRRIKMHEQIMAAKVEKQRNLFNSLKEQIAARKHREMYEKECELKETQRISADIAKQDQRDLEEETRIMKKHFGERISETVGLRNVKQRIAAINKTADVKPNAISLPSCDSEYENTDFESKENLQVDVSLLVDIKNSSPSRLKQVSVVESVVAMSETRRTSISPDHLNESHQKEMKSSMNSKINTDVTDVAVAHVRSVHEEKFNSDNLKVRDPISYNLNLELDALGSGLLHQPILKFSSLSNSINDDFEGSEDSGETSCIRHDSFFLNMFINQSVSIPVGAQNRMVNSALLHYFIVEKKLFQHIQALNSYLCLQNGLFGHFLTALLIQEVKNTSLTNKGDIPRKSGRLNEILGEAMALSADGNEKSDFRDNVGFILARENIRNSMDFDNAKPVKSKTLTSCYEVLDDITLNYSVEWPLSIFITDDLLINYEKLFTFLMRLYRAELLLLGLSSVLKFKGSKSRQLTILHHYRYRMLHFVRTVRHYINVTVIHCAWTDLTSSFYKMNSLDKIYEGLVRHIKFVTTNCLLGAKGEGVKKLLLDQLIVIECFCSEVEEYSRERMWEDGKEIHSRQFAKLDQKFKVWEEIQKVFIQVFFKLAVKGTYQKVAYFLQLFNFNGYFGNTFTGFLESSTSNK